MIYSKNILFVFMLLIIWKYQIAQPSRKYLDTSRVIMRVDSNYYYFVNGIELEKTFNSDRNSFIEFLLKNKVTKITCLNSKKRTIYELTIIDSFNNIRSEYDRNTISVYIYNIIKSGYYSIKLPKINEQRACFFINCITYNQEDLIYLGKIPKEKMCFLQNILHNKKKKPKNE